MANISKIYELCRVILSVDTCFLLCIRYKYHIWDVCTVLFNLVIYEYSFFQSNFYKNLVALHSYLKQTRLINGQRVTRPTCLLCLAQLLQANTLNHAHMHTLHTQQGSERNTPARNTAPCIDWAKTTSCSWCPGLLFIWKSCGRAASPSTAQPKGEGCVCAENTLTGVVPLASTPAAMTTIMQMMTKVVTQRSAVLQSIWPQFTIRKLQSTAPQRWWEQFMCYYPWIITFHSFARHQWTYSIQRAIV